MNIAICHYKIGKKDGVSLEIEKREKALREMGYSVYLITGISGYDKKEKENHNIYEIPALDFDYPKGHMNVDLKVDIERIKKNVFSGFELKNNETYANVNDIYNDIDKIATAIEKTFLRLHSDVHFDFLFLHNIFSHGRHISAAKAFHDIIVSTKIKTIAVNHDFYESYGDMYKLRPGHGKLEQFLYEFIPPSFRNVKHVTINSIMKDFLLKKLNRKNVKLDSKIVIFPDTFEFEQHAWAEDDYNKDLLKTVGIENNNLIVLQATRIVKRKSIELTIDLISELNNRKDDLAGKRIYNGKRLGKNFDIIFVFAQKEEQDSVVYKERLIRKMKDKGIKYIFIDDRIESRRIERNGKKIYSLWDSYVYADLVSYPSTWEGFGNQFLEAVFAKKPLILFEYPVFQKDIAQDGYRYISLGNTIEPQVKYFKTVSMEKTQAAAEATLHMLLDEGTNLYMDSNFHKARQKYGEERLNCLLRECLDFNA